MVVKTIKVILERRLLTDAGEMDQESVKIIENAKKIYVVDYSEKFRFSLRLIFYNKIVLLRLAIEGI